MTIPFDKNEIKNLRQIAELNQEAGDWQYTPVSKDSKLTSPDILKQVGNVKLPKQ